MLFGSPLVREYLFKIEEKNSPNHNIDNETVKDHIHRCVVDNFSKISPV